MTNLTMPPLDTELIARRNEIAAMLRRLVGNDHVVDDEPGLRAYESDGLTAYAQMPMLAVLPADKTEIAAVLRYCHEQEIKIVPRGAGTSLSGGALPLGDGVLLAMTRLSDILDIDYANRCAVVQPGVTNLAVSEAVAAEGFYYAPDPSSQIACTIGGNIAENSGGIHCLKYGVTVNNVLGLEIVLMNGETVRLGGRGYESEGYDLVGLLTGSEGLLGIVTEATIRLLHKPEHAQAALLGFAAIEDGGACIAAIIEAGIIPAGMEMMDRPAIAAVEEFMEVGYPDAEAVIIVELDGPAVEVATLLDRVSAIAHQHRATSIQIGETEADRLRFWAGRKAAFPAVGRISPDYLCMDGTIPRAQLPYVLSEIRALSERYDLRVVNVFHAGDGNLHPLILFDANLDDELTRAEDFGADILRLCVRVGGVLTGEHGVGVEKRDLMPEMFSEDDLKQQQRVKCAFDPQGLLNPGKVFPTLHRCAELGMMRVHKGRLPFPDLPRF